MSFTVFFRGLVNITVSDINDNSPIFMVPNPQYDLQHHRGRYIIHWAILVSTPSTIVMLIFFLKNQSMLLCLFVFYCDNWIYFLIKSYILCVVHHQYYHEQLTFSPTSPDILTSVILKKTPGSNMDPDLNPGPNFTDYFVAKIGRL